MCSFYDLNAPDPPATSYSLGPTGYTDAPRSTPHFDAQLRAVQAAGQKP